MPTLEQLNKKLAPIALKGAQKQLAYLKKSRLFSLPGLRVIRDFQIAEIEETIEEARADMARG